MTKELNTLVEDIYDLFNPEKNHEVSEENLEVLCENLKDVLRQRLKAQDKTRGALRFSSLGKPDRQLWFEAHPDPDNTEKMLPKTYLKFMYGDVIEQLLLFLVRESGHSVEMEQAEVEYGGVKGHIDCIVDGVLVDVKSASPFGFKKFKEDNVPADDPFGYVEQLSGYSSILTPGQDAAWLAMDKVAGDICVSTLPNYIIEQFPPQEKIEHQKKVIESETPPELCHQPVPDGKSGNLKLPTPCSYCSHKFRCHPGVRTFIYSTGPRYLTKVARTPDVHEVKGKGG